MLQQGKGTDDHLLPLGDSFLHSALDYPSPVRPSVTPSLIRLLGTSYAQYSALLTSGFRFLADDEHAEE